MFMINDRVVWVANDGSAYVGTVTDIPIRQTYSRGAERRAVVEWDDVPPYGAKITEELYTGIFTIDEYNARMGTDLE